MAFKLTKAQDAELEKLLAHAREMFGQLEAEIDDINGKLDEIRNELAEKQSAYNEAQDNLRAFIQDDLVAGWRGEWDERSEKWQEGDRGQGVSGWIDEWENISFDEASLEGPEDLDMPENVLDEVEGVSRDASEVA